MRAHRSAARLVVVLVALAGCRPAEEPVVVAPPDSPAPAPEPARSPAPLDERVGVTIVDLGVVDTQSPAPARVLDRLVYQCTDDVTFAARIIGNKLQVFPPSYSNGYIVLDRIVSDDGVHFATRDADFRAKDDLATLRVGPDRYVDCVSNPAAAVWQDLASAAR